MAVERAGTAKLLDVLEHVAGGGVVVIGDAKFEASGGEGRRPASCRRDGDPPATT